MEQVINNFMINLNSVGRGFCDYAGNMFMQSSVLIILLLIIDFLLRKRVRAVFRYCIWMLVFVKLILPPTLSLPTGIGYWSSEFPPSEQIISKPLSNVIVPESVKPIMPEEAEISTKPPQLQPSHPFSQTAVPLVSTASSLPSITWQAIVFLIWLVGLLVFSVLLIQRLFFVRSLLLQSELAKGRLLDVLNQCCRQVDIRRCVELKLSNTLQSPAVCGLFKPVILIPTSLLEKLSRDKLRAVLIHELAHIKRGDLWVNLIQTLLQIIYFYNPFVWLANIIVRRIREQAVDEAVLVALGNEAESYSNTLIDIAEMVFWKANFSLRLIGIAESEKALHRRIKHMLTRPIPKSAKIGFLGLLVVAILGALLLPMAAAATKDNKKDETRFIATIPTGVTVELVGICEYPSTGKQWWRPDGVLFEAQQVYVEKKGSDTDEGCYGFVTQVSEPEDLSFCWAGFEGSDGWWGTCNVFDAKQGQLEGFEAAVAKMAEGKTTTAVRVGIAAGQWNTVAGHDGTNMCMKGSVAFSKAYESDGSVHIIVTDNFGRDVVQRIVAIDTDGNLHTWSGYCGSVSSEKMRQTTGTFPNLKLSQIKEFQFQTRPYE